VAIISQTIRSTNTDIDLTQLFSQLVDESRRLNAREDTEMALPSKDQKADDKAKNSPTKPKCSHCQRKGHKEEKCWIKHPELKPAPRQGQNKAKNTPKKPQEEEELSLFSNDIALSSTIYRPN